MTEVRNGRARDAGDDVVTGQAHAEGGGLSRRRFMGYLIAAPTLVAAAQMGVAAESASAAGIPSPQPTDAYDLSDILTDAAQPTMALLTVTVNKDSTVNFAIPRAEVGQGLTTSFAMIIADEMDVPVENVKCTLADARPELVWNQLTGGSNSTHALYSPVRVAAAIARGSLLDAASALLDYPASALGILDGVIIGPGGKSLKIGDVAEQAAASKTTAVKNVTLKKRADLKLLGTEMKRVDARLSVTGAKQFAMDLDVPNALPTMVCRPPTINGKALAILNKSDIDAMPGVTDVALIPHTPYVAGGVAVRAQTFGQCIDAVRALKVRWGAGSVDGMSDASVLKDLKNAELPMTPAVPAGTVIDKTYTFHFRPGDPLETNCAVADVRSGSAEIWSSLKNPIWAKEQIAVNCGLPINKVTVHVTEGGGSFGRHLFSDAAFESAAISKKLGKPVKLMWHRTDSFRQGRVSPMTTSRIRTVYSGANVLAWDQRHTAVPTDLTHGLGEVVTATGETLPGANFATFAETVWSLTASVPYNFGAVTQLLNEIYQYNTFNTSAVRNVYSPGMRTACELMTDELANAMGKDRLAFRQAYIKDQRMLAVLNAAAEAGNWGRAMPAGTAQGIGIHKEYKGFAACMVEIDCTAATVNRKVEDAFTGPRVTKAIFAVDVGKPINVLGLKAQMMGGTMDGIAQALTYGLQLKDGHYLQGSWDDAYYTRQWNVPPEFECIVMPENAEIPGGAGELGVAASMAATACAYGKAMGTLPTEFPINHGTSFTYDPFPNVPPIPPPGSNGLSKVGIIRATSKTAGKVVKKKTSTKKKKTHKVSHKAHKA